MINFLFFIYIFLGYALSKYISGNAVNKEGRIRSVKFKLGKYAVHLHHWIWNAFILLLLSFLGYFNYFVFGILIGAMTHGLTYKDAFVVFKKNKR